jgi:hypothetical protein
MNRAEILENSFGISEITNPNRLFAALSRSKHNPQIRKLTALRFSEMKRGEPESINPLNHLLTAIDADVDQAPSNTRAIRIVADPE